MEAEKVTVKELDAILEKLKALSVKKEEIAESLSEVNKEIQRLEGQCDKWLEELGRKDYASQDGKVERKETLSVRMPENPLEKEKFWKYLEEQGLFKKYATVQSNSLNKIFKEALKEAEEKGEDPMLFNLPGLPPPVLDRFAKFKAAK